MADRFTTQELLRETILQVDDTCESNSIGHISMPINSYQTLCREKSELKCKLENALRKNKEFDSKLKSKIDQLLAVEIQTDIYKQEVSKLEKEKTEAQKRYNKQIDLLFHAILFQQSIFQIACSSHDTEIANLCQNSKWGCPYCKTKCKGEDIYAHLIAHEKTIVVCHV